MKGLFWCQYILGIGHLLRGLRLCEALSQHFEIDFLQGGRDVGLTIESPHFKKINLPPISNNDQDPITGILAPKDTVAAVLQERKEILLSTLNKPYDFFISGSFPFGKLAFEHEILTIINRIKEINPKCLIISSVNDISYHSPENSAYAKNILRTYYNHIFIHSDPQIIRLEETSALIREVPEICYYTGYVAIKPPEHLATKKKKQIVVTTGGGGVCEELVHAVAQITIYFPDHQFIFILGPNSPKSLQKNLKILQEMLHPSNIQITEFVEDFTECLNQSALVITLAGSTLVDMCLTKTPGLIYPFISPRNLDQQLRAEKFAALGGFTIIHQEDLKPEWLKTLIQERLEMPFPEIKINADGAENTVKKVMDLL